MHIQPLFTISPFTGAFRAVTISLLGEAYLAPRLPEWDLGHYIDDATFPWAESYLQAPDDVCAAVLATLRDLVQAVPGLCVENLDLSNMPEGRARTHVEALKSLWERASGQLPEDLAVLRHVIGCDSADALEVLPVTSPQVCPFSTRAQRDLHATLLTHHGLDEVDQETKYAPGALGHVQAHMLADRPATSPDDSIAVFGFRDPFEEADFAAARAQALCDSGFAPSEIGLLLPDAPIYQTFILAAFARVGLPLSGGKGAVVRDHEGELLTLALSALKSSGSTMARASLCLSPLMPWSESDGRSLADAVMSGRVKFVLPNVNDAKRVLDTLWPVINLGAVFARLDALAELTTQPDALHARIAGARAAHTGETLDWIVLERAFAPRTIQEAPPAKSVEGVSLFVEAALPWRPVRELIVLGMCGASWPRKPQSNPFFTEREFEQIEAKTGLVLTSRKRILQRELELFRRQIGAATERLTLCVPAHDMMGTILSHSVGLTLVAKALGELEDSTRLIQIPGERDTTFSALATMPELSTPSLPAGGMLALGSNLLLLRQEKETGFMKPQSVSRLETMLVSPFAWALGEIGAQEKLWLPQSLDVKLLGTIVHDVLEHVFVANVPTPDDVAIVATLPTVFEEAIGRSASWLREEIWDLERENLMVEARGSALAWGRFLRETKGETIGTEQHLQGMSPTLAIRTHGFADCLLKLADGRVMVVDHKRSKSAKRLDRLEKGGDLQATLYGEMLLNPQGDDALDMRDLGESKIVPAYHLTLDHVVLAGDAGQGIRGVQTVPGAIAQKALDVLSDRIKDLKIGRISLNRVSDGVRFEKEMGIPLYALNDNRLVSAFLMLDEEDAA